jgi:hypothetical protein
MSGTRVKEDEWDKSERSDEWDKSERSDEWDKSERSDEWDKSERSDEWDKSERSDEWDKSERSDEWDKSESNKWHTAKKVMWVTVIDAPVNIVKWVTRVEGIKERRVKRVKEKRVKRVKRVKSVKSVTSPHLPVNVVKPRVANRVCWFEPSVVLKQSSNNVPVLEINRGAQCENVALVVVPRVVHNSVVVAQRQIPSCCMGIEVSCEFAKF